MRLLEERQITSDLESGLGEAHTCLASGISARNAAEGMALLSALFLTVSACSPGASGSKRRLRRYYDGEVMSAEPPTRQKSKMPSHLVRRRQAHLRFHHQEFVGVQRCLQFQEQLI